MIIVVSFWVLVSLALASTLFGRCPCGFCSWCSYWTCQVLALSPCLPDCARKWIWGLCTIVHHLYPPGHMFWTLCQFPSFLLSLVATPWWVGLCLMVNPSDTDGRGCWIVRSHSNQDNRGCLPVVSLQQELSQALLPLLCFLPYHAEFLKCLQMCCHHHSWHHWFWLEVSDQVHWGDEEGAGCLPWRLCFSWRLWHFVLVLLLLFLLSSMLANLLVGFVAGIAQVVLVVLVLV